MSSILDFESYQLYKNKNLFVTRSSDVSRNGTLILIRYIIVSRRNNCNWFWIATIVYMKRKIILLGLRPRRRGGEERQQDDEYSLFHIAGN